MTSINSILATEHRADLLRFADERRHGSEITSRPASAPAQTITLRLAQPGDQRAVQRLAALDDAPALQGEVLLALVNEEPVAALSLGDDRVVANPFLFTQDAVGLLRAHGRHLGGERLRRRWHRLRRPRPRLGRPRPAV